MPDNSNKYDNGLNKWEGTMYPQTNSNQSNLPFTPVLPSNVLVVRLGCNIKTNVNKFSLKIINPKDPSKLIAHFELSEISSWDVNGDIITLKSSDNINYLLLFDTDIEAKTADLRIFKMLEGNNITNCGDELL